MEDEYFNVKKKRMYSIFEEKQNVLIKYTNNKVQKLLECVQSEIKAKYDRKLEKFTDDTNKNFAVCTNTIISEH